MTTIDCLPDDETGDALSRLGLEGSDLTRPMSIDFFAHVPDRMAGEKVAAAVRKVDFTASVEYDEESKTWTCYCTKTLVPNYQTVRSTEDQIDHIARKFGGKGDGFASFGNATRKH